MLQPIRVDDEIILKCRHFFENRNPDLKDIGLADGKIVEIACHLSLGNDVEIKRIGKKHVKIIKK